MATVPHPASPAQLPVPAQTLRAAIYTRVSTNEQSERGYSLEAQAEDCRKLARELAATVVAEFTDSESGANWDLTGLNAMLDAAKRREFDLLLCYDPDRLARRMAKQMVIEEELARSGVTIKYVTLRLGDSAEDRLLKNVRSSIAEYEREKIALRTARGRRAKAEKGLVVGTGVPPYGYRYTYDGNGHIAGMEPDPETAPIIRRIFQEITQYSLDKVCQRLIADGVPTYRGALWSSASLWSCLNNPVYLGTAAYGRRDTRRRWRGTEQWIYSAVPPLVDRETWDAAHAAMAYRKSAHVARTAPEADPFALRGLLTCGHCGGVLSCQTQNPRWRYYICLRREGFRAELQGRPLCPIAPIPAQALDDYVWELVRTTLLDADYLDRGLREAQQQYTEASGQRDSRTAALDREIARLRTKLARTTSARMDAEPGSETDIALKAVQAETETAIRRVLTERAELEATATGGLSPEDTRALRQAVADIQDELGNTEWHAPEQRRLYNLLRLRGTVRLTDASDPNGIKLGRHTFLPDLTAAIPIRHGANEFVNIKTVWIGDAGGGQTPQTPSE